jgi:ribosomal-protein-alanine N-acetyltransferase
LLEEILPDDQAFIFEGLSHPEVIPFYGVSYTTFEETAGQMEFYSRVWREQTGAYWKIVSKETGVRLGVCGISGYIAQHEKAELGAWLLPRYWKQGVMTEVMPIVIAFAFEHWRLHRIEGVVEEGNEASSRLMKKLGFVYEGTMREAELKKGKRVSLEVYSLLKREF